MCELSTVSSDAWNVHSHPIRRLTLHVGSGLDSDDEGDDNDDDEDEDESGDDVDGEAVAADAQRVPALHRFLLRIGHPLLSLSLRFGANQRIDDLVAVLPVSCPNLERLNISGGSLESFESIVHMFHQGLKLDALDIWIDAVEDSASISSFASELQDATSAMSQSLREITIIVSHADEATDELLLREMHLVAKQHPQLRWLAIQVAANVADRHRKMVDAIAQLRCRQYSLPLSIHNKLAFLSAIDHDRRRQHDVVSGRSALTTLSREIVLLIFDFAADCVCATGNVLRRD
ncbi:hypothetical protein PINS_up017213 [Pythium insidiosum]|nr:hypothetical protein PINS_up017213 [Pythium insidiosum]